MTRRHVFCDCDRVFEADSELLALLDSHGVTYITWTAPPVATGPAPSLDTATETASVGAP